tara:strand:- start:326 stop:556 length:231 start_codon:yes stop_codon:yes gene_type:complete
MTNKGFTETNNNIETPSNVNVAEKPLKEENFVTSRVDINILKANLQKTQSKELKKNIIILSTLVIGLAIVGIYLSL